jgi:hypothetical protein
MRTASRESLKSVKDFWETHVNNEYYTGEAQASEAYFSEIETGTAGMHLALLGLGVGPATS